MKNVQPSIESKHTLLCPQEPEWVSPDRVVDPLFVGEVSHWLLDPNSLTHKLRSIYAEHFNLELLSWQQEAPLGSERALLNSNDDQPIWVRQVILRNQQTPLIFARSVMSGNNTSLMQTLSGLGNQSLGDYLFHSAEVLRGEIQIAKVTSEMRLLKPFVASGLSHAESYWARRCVYKIGLARLLVNEVYLPSNFWGGSHSE